MSCAAPTGPREVADPADELPGPLRAYAIAVREADIECNSKIRDARHERDARVNEALETYERVMAMRKETRP